MKNTLDIELDVTQHLMMFGKKKSLANGHNY